MHIRADSGLIQRQVLIDLIGDIFLRSCVSCFGLCGRRKAATSLRRSCSTTRTTQPGALPPPCSFPPAVFLAQVGVLRWIDLHITFFLVSCLSLACLGKNCIVFMSRNVLHMHLKPPGCCPRSPTCPGNAGALALRSRYENKQSNSSSTAQFSTDSTADTRR